MADFGGIVLILATSLGLYIVAILIKYFEQLWWTPNRIQKMMAAQGINGPAYKIVAGNSKEIYNMIQEARSKPLGLSHDIFPVVQPHLYVWIKKYGKIFLHWNGIRAKLVISDPDLAREVLTDKEKVYPKGANEGFLRKILGDGLTTSGGDKWERVRKIANHSFHGESLKAMTPATLASAEQMLDRWKAFNGKEIDVFKEFKFLTSEVISRTGFGSSYKEGEKIFEMFHQMALLYFRNTYKPRIPGISKFYKTPDEIESDRLEQGVREMIIELIRRKEKKAMLGEEDFESYFLGALVKAHHNKTEKVKISVDDLVDECKTFYFAAQETVNGTLAWTMLLLSLHPEWQEEARKEVLQVFGKQLPNADGLPKLKTMQMILHETLRLYSPVVYLERRAIREVKLGHITIPKNVDVVIPCVALHHEPQLWGNDAHLFKPERFAEGVAKATNNNIATYLPFGMGPRICVGSNFAQNELRIVLSMILQRYSFTLSPAYVHAPCRSTVVLPQHGVQVILHPL